MQLDLDYERSGWDDYEFAIDKGKTRDGQDSKHDEVWLLGSREVAG